MNEIMMEIIEEETSPDEIFLEDMAEEELDLEDDTIFGTAEVDDDIIEYIEDGMKLGYEDPIDFTDADVDSAVFDDYTDDVDDIEKE